MTEPITLVCGRRAALVAAGAAGLAGLAGCSGGDTADTSSSTSTSASSSTTSEAAGEAGGELATTSEIPVGGGIVFADAGVIVTQPTEGEFKAFSNICTHQGAKIDRVHDGVMECPLHHSKFRIADGSVVAGSQASQPLPEKTVKVDGDSISVT